MRCEHCLKPRDLCLCNLIQPLATRTQILILQHPQEPNENLGTARIAHLALSNSSLKVGLSWPNLKRVLGNEAQASQWGVLYLGSGLKTEEAIKHPSSEISPVLQFVTQKGAPIPRPPLLEGMVILDGTWSQAKALWWRNPWLLKLKRAILLPKAKSLYKNLRKEPRPECLSTIESIAETLTALGEPPEVSDSLKGLFKNLLDKHRTRYSDP